MPASTSGQCRLARAVVADHGNELALEEGEVDAAQVPGGRGSRPRHRGARRSDRRLAAAQGRATCPIRAPRWCSAGGARVAAATRGARTPRAWVRQSRSVLRSGRAFAAPAAACRPGGARRRPASAPRAGASPARPPAGRGSSSPGEPSVRRARARAARERAPTRWPRAGARRRTTSASRRSANGSRSSASSAPAARRLTSDSSSPRLRGPNSTSSPTVRQNSCVDGFWKTSPTVVDSPATVCVAGRSACDAHVAVERRRRHGVRNESVEAACERGLAAARRAGHEHALTLTDGRIDAIERPAGAESDGHLVEPDHRGSVSSTARCIRKGVTVVRTTQSTRRIAGPRAP